jgi:hypothetical protein
MLSRAPIRIIRDWSCDRRRWSGYKPRTGDVMMAGAQSSFRNGHETFLFRGTNNRWFDVLTNADLDLYERKANAQLSPSLSRWLREGRMCAGDPSSAPD